MSENIDEEAEAYPPAIWIEDARDGVVYTSSPGSLISTVKYFREVIGLPITQEEACEALPYTANLQNGLTEAIERGGVYTDLIDDVKKTARIFDTITRALTHFAAIKGGAGEMAHYEAFKAGYETAQPQTPAGTLLP